MFFRNLVRHRALLAMLTRREIEARYRGSLLGALWIVVSPLLMLGVYTFVFSVVFKARWPGLADAGHGGYALVLFSGLILFNFFAECLTRSPGLVRENVNYVKKVVFPLELLPVVACLSAMFNAAVGFSILFLFYFALVGVPPATTLLLPLVLCLLFGLGLGIALLLASLGVFIPDLRQVMPPLATVLMFFSPVFYPASALPEGLRFLFLLNPMTGLLETSKALLFAGQSPSFLTLGISVAYALAVFAAGAWWFARTKHAFADVL